MEPEKMVHGFKQEEIEKWYKFWSHNVQNLLTAEYGEEWTGTVEPQIRDKFKELEADLPFIGGPQNPWAPTLVWSAYWLAVYQVLRGQGKTVHEVGKLIYDDFHLTTARFSEEELGKVQTQRFSDEYIAEQQRLAVQSQNQPFSDGWMCTFVAGDGETFDWGMDYKSCCICTFYHKHSADELVQFICMTDFYSSEKLGLGLERSQTIADGFEVCNFRYKKARETRMNWMPEFLKG